MVGDFDLLSSLLRLKDHFFICLSFSGFYFAKTHPSHGWQKIQVWKSEIIYFHLSEQRSFSGPCNRGERCAGLSSPAFKSLVRL